MPFNPDVKRKIVRDRKTGLHYPCVMCGITYPAPQAAHIIDEKEWKGRHGGDKQINGIPLCPNCHWVFESILRPKLYVALDAFGTRDLPQSWKKNNKISHTETDDNVVPAKQGGVKVPVGKGKVLVGQDQ
jgi:hypothetical protein